MKKTVLFIDEDDIERRSSLDVLKEIFSDTDLTVQACAPLSTLADYTNLVNDQMIGALILDQRLNTSGTVSYSGVALAAHLRGVGTRIPIFILTNYPEDDFSAQGWAVESIVGKNAVLRDPAGTPAQDFKSRLSRQVEGGRNVLAVRENRFHELIIKSSREELTVLEEGELRELEGERIAPVAASERKRLVRLDAEIEKLQKLLGKEGHL